MSERAQLLAELWREVGRGRELRAIVQRAASLLAERVPLAALVVKRMVIADRSLVTEAVHSIKGVELRLPHRAELSAEQLEWLQSWCARGLLIRCDPRSRRDLVRFALLPGIDGDGLVGPLVTDAGPVGLATAVTTRGERLTQAHSRVFKLALEPLAVALADHVERCQTSSRGGVAHLDEDSVFSGERYRDLEETIVGARTSLRRVLEQVDQVAPTDAPVLIFGETGTGKEVIARAIHARSDRSRGPMFRVNCGAIPPELVDSELFGHERGSFTGAVGERKGWFERADGGTLFLDEVGELPLAAQVRLLRVLQDGTLERVGGQRTLTVDVRVVAATNADLEAMVEAETFRKDLWYRISVFPIRLPPLRDRAEDVAPLTCHFALRAGVRLGGQPLEPTADDIELLTEYQWPGNVRELAAVVERAAILGGGRRLCIAAALGGRVTVPEESVDQAAAEQQGFPTLDQAMRRHIERALAVTGGRIEGPRGAAALLRINPHTLRARMRKLGLDWSRFRHD